MDLIKLDPFNSFGNGTNTLVTDNNIAGRSIHAFIFELGGTAFTKAMISSLAIIQNGKEYCPTLMTGAQLQDLNDYAGYAADAVYLVYWFGDPTARTIRGQHLGDLDMSIYRDKIEFNMVVAGATAPTCQIYALCGVPKKAMFPGDPYSDSEAATVRALIRSVQQPGGAVKAAYQIGLGSEAGAKIRALNFFHTNLTSVELRKQGEIKVDDASNALNTFIESQFARTAQAGLYVLDRIVDGNQGESETTLKADGSAWNFQVNLTTSAADTITTFADVYTMPPLL